MLRILRDVVLACAICLLMVFLWTTIAQAGTIVGNVKARGVKSPQGVVVYMDHKHAGRVSTEGKTATLDQFSMVFVPRILPVTVGTTVNILNSDDVPHTAFTPSEVGDKFDSGIMVKGDAQSFTFNKPGVIPVLCALHPEMEAYIVVLKNPLYAVSDEKGNFEFTNVSAGTHRLSTWHKKLKTKTTDVEVPDQGTVEVTFKLRR